MITETTTPDMSWLGNSDRHNLRMTIPAPAETATPEALVHYLAEREHYIDLAVDGREIDFGGRIAILFALHVGYRS